MSVSDIDAALRQAQTATVRLGSRLFELDEECDRRAAEANGLRGVSATAWQSARDQITVLWTWYQALSTAVASLATRRQSPGFNRLDRHKADALWSDLRGTSVVLSEESMVLARRCLPDERDITCAWAIVPLLEFMSSILGGAAETVTSLFVVRDAGLSRLGGISAALDHIEQAARAAGVRVPNHVASMQSALPALREQLATDPLAVPLDRVAVLSATVAQAGEDVDAAAARLRNVDEALDRIDADLQAGLGSLDQSVSDLAAVETKLTRPADLPNAQDIAGLKRRMIELAAKLEEARRLATAGDRAAAVRLAEALASAAAVSRSAAAAVERAVAAPLERRRELRGRLDAYRAKAYRLGQAEDPQLSQLHLLAENALYIAPCDLDEAEQRVAAYQKGVAGAGLAPARREGCA